MGIYTFANFKSYLTLALGNRDGLTTCLPIWVNAAYIGLCSINKVVSFRKVKNLIFPELDTSKDESTIDGQAYISRPSNTLAIHTVWDTTNDRKLDYKSPAWYFEQTGRANTSSEGDPFYWIPYGNLVYLYPTPDDDYNMKIYYRKRPSRLVEDGHTTAIGEEWDEAILQFAKSKASADLRDFTTSAFWKKEFIETIAGQVGMQEKETIDLKEFFRIDPTYDDFGY